MAQTGFTPISNYYSATATNVPTAGNLVAGELAINTADGKLFYKDSSGVVQTMASKATTAGTYSSITTSNLTIGTTQLGAGNASIMKNRIINGAMVIDQRNAGASVTITNTAALTYTLDRWAAYGSQASKFSVQQTTGTSDGFPNSQVVTSLSSLSIGTGDVFKITQLIEGYNIADLNWGGATAKTVTLSFWVKSSLTGTFGGAVLNSAFNRSYPFSYTISAANTWEQKSITITGDTTGTWLTTNGIGMQIVWGLGIGSSISGTAGAWTAGNVQSATGATSVVGTNGATFYITGVQLEVGSSATGFEYRQYTTELQLCQRYYYLHARGSANQTIGVGLYYDSTTLVGFVAFPTTMRSAPSMVVSSGTDYFTIYRNGAADTFDTFTGINEPSTTMANIRNGSQVSGTAGQAGLIITTQTAASLAFNSEL